MDQAPVALDRQPFYMDHSVVTEYLVSAGIFAGVWARTRMDVLPKGADSGGFATAGIFLGCLKRFRHCIGTGSGTSMRRHYWTKYVSGCGRHSGCGH